MLIANSPHKSWVELFHPIILSAALANALSAKFYFWNANDACVYCVKCGQTTQSVCLPHLKRVKFDEIHLQITCNNKNHQCESEIRQLMDTSSLDALGQSIKYILN